MANQIANLIYEIEAHPKVTCLDLGLTGRVLVTGGQDRNVNLWAMGNENRFMSLPGHNSSIECVRFACNDDHVFSTDEYGIIKKWDLNSSPENCATFHGHMKSVKTLDFHPFGEFMVSGSHDTSIRLWDTRKKECIKRYRRQITAINSVKFSPDGSWIASACNEGAIIIWDIRMNREIMEFEEPRDAQKTRSCTFLQFHPFEFLLAAGRADGSCDLYDLENKHLISRNDRAQIAGNRVRCLIFSENGECLFVGANEGLSTIGWEPDRNFDYVESVWDLLGDMKLINQKLIVGSFQEQKVRIHALSVNKIKPFYNPTNKPFSYNQSTRKSFSCGHQSPMKLSAMKATHESTSMEEEEEEEHEMAGVDTEPPIAATGPASPFVNEFQSFSPISYSDSGVSSQNFECSMLNRSPPSSSSASVGVVRKQHLLNETFAIDDDEQQLCQQQMLGGGVDSNYASDLDYYPVKHLSSMSGVPVLAPTAVYDQPEKEDFPITNAQLPNYAPKIKTKTNNVRQKTEISQQRRTSQPNVGGGSGGGVHKTQHPHQQHQQTFGFVRKLTNSVSTMELNKIGTGGDSHQFLTTARKPLSRGSSPVRNYQSPGGGHQIPTMNKLKKSDSTTNLNRENNYKNANGPQNIQVQILTKPQRSKTLLDLKSNGSNNMGGQRAQNKYTSETSNEQHEIQLMTSCHDSVYHALSNRHATLVMIKNAARTTDMLSALRNAVKINDHAVVVDLLGAILEKTSSWNLDMCVLILPEIYELLQSEYKFHCTRACDTLRVILSTFLPIIQANTDPWSPARSLGVDVTREERQNKCLECKQWLLRIRMLSENKHVGSTLVQLQNMIVDI